jgi:cbb3-type cytochrome oxidase cytochrome c subunit/mono/diheme cytochrome c family protein
VTPSPGKAVRYAYVVACVAGVLFFVLSVALLGMWPKRILDAQSAAMAPPHPLGLSASALRGRAVYAREGCGYCHTQQVRYLHSDMTRFGAPTLAWETRLDYPHQWGTRRIGPDLSRTSGVRSADWHYAHLFAPRSIVAHSVMPSFPHLFDGAADRPRQEARDLVTYLDTLGRAREIAGPEGEAHAREGCNCPDDHMQMAFEAPVNAHPARPRRADDAPALPLSADASRGQALYADRCAGCHGIGGDGDGPGASSLRPKPSNLVEHSYSDARLARVLWNGVPGTSMPAWRDHSPADLAALAAHVKSLEVRRQDPALPERIGELGAQVYNANCIQCHGEDGDGRGTAAQELPMLPVSFREQRPSLDLALRVIRNGVEGTPMAPWTSRLGAAEILAVAHHVRSLYQEGRQ